MVMELLYDLLSVCLFILLVLFLAVNAYFLYVHRKYAHLPTPKGASFYLGHLSLVVSHLKEGKFFLDLLKSWSEECGQVYVLWRVYWPVVVVAHPDSIKELATVKYPKPYVGPMVKLWNRQRALGNSLLTVQHYKDWKDRRRTYDASFSRNYLNGLFPWFNKVTDEHLVKYLKGCADGKCIVDMKKVFTNLTLQVISLVAFGTDFSKDKYVQDLCGSDDLLTLLDLTLEGMFHHNNNPLVPYIRFFGGYKYTDSLVKLRKIGNYCIKNRIQAIKNGEDIPQDVLTQIIKRTQNEDSTDIEDLVDDFVAFYVAGQETTSNLLSFTLVELLQNPEVLKRVLVEIDEVFGDKEAIDKSDLDQLDYTTAVLEESLRLYPPAPMMGKLLPEDTVLNNYRVPKNSVVMICSYLVHHNPEYFDDPTHFDPSRFEAGQKRPSPYIYFPFGIGHRSCIGRAFAMMEAKVILVSLLRNFDLTLPKDYKLKRTHAITSKPIEGIPCTLEIRTRDT